MGIQLANGNTFFIFKKTGVIDIERSLDYFYGQAGELFSFYRIPKALFQEQRFQTLSTDAKTLYGILLDRMSLSAKNGWLDEQGRVFIIFTIEDVKRALCCADNKATKMLRELEEFGLIERKRRGLGKPSLVYVKNFSAESLKSIFQNRDFNDSGGFKSASQDPAKSRCNKTEENNTEKSETNPFYSEEDDGMSKREQLEEYFSQSLEIETLLRLCPDDEDVQAAQIQYVNSVIMGMAQYLQTSICSRAYHAIDRRVNNAALAVWKKLYPKRYNSMQVSLKVLCNLPDRHKGYDSKTFAVWVEGKWFGITYAFITHSHYEPKPFDQKMTPYTVEGRRRYVNYRAKHKSLPCDRPSVNSPNDIAMSAYAKGRMNFEYYMNREYAYSRDKGKCKCCGNAFSPMLQKHCHHVKNKLPLDRINKVPNLVWL